MKIRDISFAEESIGESGEYGDIGDGYGDIGDGDMDYKFVSIMKDVLRSGIPSMLSYLAIFSVELISLFYLGRLGDAKYLATGGLAQALYTICCLSLILGMMSCLEALTGQAYGKGNFYLLGVYLNRARVVYTILSLPSLFILYFSGYIMTALRLDTALIPLTSGFLFRLIPAALFTIQFEAERRFIQAHGFFALPMKITAITLLLHPIICYLFIIYMDLGMMGAAYAQTLNASLNFFFLHFSIQYYKLYAEGSWFVPNSDTWIWSECIDFMKMSLWSASMIIVEWWAFDLLTLYATQLGVVALSLNVIAINLVATYFMFPLGISSVLSVRVGNYIGAMNLPHAKRFAKVGMVLTLIILVLICIIYLMLRDIIPRLFTDQEEVIKEVQPLMIIIAFLCIPDGYQGALGGVLRGLGEQNSATKGSIFAYYPIMQLSALFLAFTCHLGVQGLWIAAIIGSISTSAYFSYIVWDRDWEQIAKKAKNRMHMEEMMLIQGGDPPVV